MARKSPTLSDQVRLAIERADVSRYAIARKIGCSQALLSRFMSRTGGLSLDVLDRLAAELRLRVAPDGPEDRPEKPPSRPEKRRARARAGES